MEELFDKNIIYKHLIENSTEGILVADKNGLIKLVNNSIVNLFGYTKEELIGQTIEKLLPLNKREKHKKQVVNYTNTPKKLKMGKGRDLQGMKKNGETVPIEISLNHITIEESFFVVAMITDISERKKAEKEIRELNENLEHKVKERTRKLNESQVLHDLISLNFPNGCVGVLDKNLNYVLIEGKELIKLGLKSENLVGTNYLDCLSNDISPGIKTKLTNVFKGKSINFDVSKNNNVYNVDVVPLIFEDNKIFQILVVEHNVTTLKKVETKIKNSLAKERELNELKSKFVSMASHEFRTPLSTILSSVSLIEKYDKLGLDEKKQKHFEKVKKTIKNLTAILDDTLTMSRLEENLANINKSKFNSKSLIEEIINESEELKSINQKISLKYKGIEEIFTDKMLFRIIISNLLSNALKYSTKDVSILIEVTKEYILVEIEDQGIGIPKKEQERLFERFFRANNVTNIQGTGLGLNIVKGYISLLKGKILLESEENKGTKVTFKLPF